MDYRKIRALLFRTRMDSRDFLRVACLLGRANMLEILIFFRIAGNSASRALR